jgi:hypothetical protein
MDNDGYISNGELFQVLKMMVGSNLKDTQLQQIVDKTILFADKVAHFTNIFTTSFLYESVFQSFSVLTVFMIVIFSQKRYWHKSCP